MAHYSIRPLLVLAILGIAFLGCTALLAAASRERDWRPAMLSMAVIGGGFLWLVTEVLSLFDLVSFPGIALSWGAGVMGLAVYLLIKGAVPAGALRRPFLGAYRSSGLFDSWVARLTAASLVLILLALGLVGLFAAPNNWDSQTYHLPQVVHWKQNRDLNFYPTHIPRQLHSAPWAEMAILHLHILAGSDQLANLVQLLALIGSLVGVSLIASQLGGDRSAQWLASLAAATLPMGILQATSTQNDYAAALWLVCFASFALRLSERPGLAGYWLAGASLGLATLTKPTAWIFAAPFAAWLGFGLLKKLGAQAWKPALIIASAVLLVNSGYFARNLQLYRSPLGPLEESADGVAFKYTNQVYTLPVLASNLLRTAGLQLSTPFEGVNQRLTEMILQLHTWLGMDANDPGTTWPGTSFLVGGWSLHEDKASNPWHFALLILSLLLLLRVPDGRLRLFAACLVTGGLLFALIFRWQPWHNRLYLPLLVLAMPLTLVVLSRFAPQRLILLLMLGFFLLAMPFLLKNKSRPLLGQDSILRQERIQQYFMNQPWLEAAYRRAIERLPEGCSEIGLILKADSWEYPLWVLAKAAGRQLTMEHVRVENNSSRYARADFQPCAVIDATQNLAEEITLDGVLYRKKYEKPPLSVFVAVE